jgi:hypothetical protein
MRLHEAISPQPSAKSHIHKIMYDSKFYPEKHELSTYHGSCHCGTVQFTFLLPSLATIHVNECNCSICEINGYLNVYPFRSDFTLDSGQGELSVYRFGKKQKQHKFCRICGTSLMIDFADQPKDPQPPFRDISGYMAINVSFSVTIGTWLTADRCGH